MTVVNKTLFHGNYDLESGNTLEYLNKALAQHNES